MTSTAPPAPRREPSFAELANAPVDADWLREVVGRLYERPADDAEAAAALRTFARAETVLAAARIRATADVASRADARHPALGPDLDSERLDVAKLPPSTAATEVAAALRITTGAAEFQIDEARLIAALPGITAAKLNSGETSMAHVRRLLQLVRNEDSEIALAGCEEAIWRQADAHPDWTPTDLRRAASRIISRHDPEALRRTHDAAREMSDVTLKPEPETGMAWLHAYLPMIGATAVKTALDAAAAAARAAGDRRPVGLLRAEALTLCAEAYLAGQPPADGQAGPATRPAAHGRPIEIQVVAPLATVLGLADEPGELPTGGPIPADAIRELARDARARLVTCDPETGALLDYGRKVYRPPAPLAAKVCATWQTSAGIGSKRPAQRCDLDHLQPHRRDGTGGATSETNLVPLDRRNHRIRTHDPALRVARDPSTGRLTWTTPFGQTVETYPYDWRLGP